MNAFNNTLKSEYFVDGILKYAFSSMGMIKISLISLKFVPKGLIDKRSALVQEMTPHRTDDNPVTRLYASPVLNEWKAAEHHHTNLC